MSEFQRCPQVQKYLRMCGLNHENLCEAGKTVSQFHFTSSLFVASFTYLRADPLNLVFRHNEFGDDDKDRCSLGWGVMMSERWKRRVKCQVTGLKTSKKKMKAHRVKQRIRRHKRLLNWSKQVQKSYWAPLKKKKLLCLHHTVIHGTLITWNGNLGWREAALQNFVCWFPRDSSYLPQAIISVIFRSLDSDF